MFFFATFYQANAQLSDVPKRHGFGVSALAGFDHDTEGMYYGAGLLYEFRPFRKVGFTAGFTYDRMTKDVSDVYWREFGGSPVYGDVWTHQLFALHAGARYYIGKLYLGGALGIGRDDGSTKLSDGTTADGGHAYNFYKSFSAGYQIPLKNNDLIELEANVFGTRSMKIGGTVRYKFGK